MIPSKLEYPAETQSQKWKPPQIDGDWNQLSSLFQNEVMVAKDIITKAQFPSLDNWIYALENGDPYAFVAVLLSQLHNLKSLQLDYTFVWQSGFTGLMMRHALLSAPENALSRFAELSIVEYGMNVPQSREFKFRGVSMGAMGAKHSRIYSHLSMSGISLYKAAQLAGYFDLILNMRNHRLNRMGQFLRAI